MIAYLLLINLMVSLGALECTHPIFCNTQILDAVSNSTYFPDSKTFTDQVLLVPIDKALYLFRTIQFEKFLSECFAYPDSVLIKTTLSDYKQAPQTFAQITKTNLRNFALDLNKRWNQLARKVDLNFLIFSTCSQDCSSFIPQMDKQTIIIPGGRFRQSYYWDSFWIIKGLIACDMLQTSQMLARNMLLMIKKYGYVPNGFRVYYLNRSQPPFLSLIIKQIAVAYRKKSLPDKAKILQQDAFNYLLIEHKFWMNKRSQTVKIRDNTFIVNQYRSQSQNPRWQSYKQDVTTASNLQQRQKKALYHQLTSIAQSGWDFSSRWYANKMDIKSAFITSLIPTDLNSILGLTEQYLFELSVKFQKQQLMAQFSERINQRRLYFSSIKQGTRYPDYFFTNKPSSRDLYPSDFYPYLFLNEKLSSNPFLTLITPSSSQTATGEQWDKPNVWAPNNWLLHQILVDQQAKKVAQQWVNTVYCSWKKTGDIYEKYRDDKLGERGEGGQYQVQTGFGWTNGLALQYLVKYGNQLADPPC